MPQRQACGETDPGLLVVRDPSHAAHALDLVSLLYRPFGHATQARTVVSPAA